MTNDDLPNRILTGNIVIKADINRFTENGVIFEGSVYNLIITLFKEWVTFPQF